MSISSIEKRVSAAAPALSRSQVKRTARRLHYLQTEREIEAALRTIAQTFDPTADAAIARITLAA